MAGDPELREVDAVGDRLHERGGTGVVHGHRVLVHHVLREHEPGVGRGHRLGRDPAVDRVDAGEREVVGGVVRRGVVVVVVAGFGFVVVDGAPVDVGDLTVDEGADRPPA